MTRALPVLLMAIFLVACPEAPLQTEAPGPLEATAQATLVHLQGTVTVLRPAGGEEEAAEVGMTLTRADAVKVAPGGYAVLELHNKHLVGVDEDLVLAIADAAFLDAPPTDVSREAQLAALLEPLGAAGASEAHARLAGARAGQAAVRTVAAEARSSAGAPARAQAPSEAPAPAPAPPPMRAARKRERSPSPPTKSAYPASPPAQDEAFGGTAASKEVAYDEAAAPSRERAIVNLATLAGDPHLRACLAGALSPRPAEVSLTLRVNEQGVIVEVLAEAPLVVPACARDNILGQILFAAQEGRHPLRIRLD